MNRSQKQSIFIVDDDVDDRDSIRDSFLENKYDVEYVFMNSGDDLMTYLTSPGPVKMPTLILLDLNMPGKDGKDVLREIKMNDRLKSIPVIIVTTSSSDIDRIMSFRLGANCFITKPNSYQELVVLTDSIAKLWL